MCYAPMISEEEMMGNAMKIFNNALKKGVFQNGKERSKEKKVSGKS